MIRFTGAGLVEAPGMLQVRATATATGKIFAGAPLATRDLTPDEIRANIRWFAVDRVGPRANPVQRVVLSGVTAIQGWELLLPELRSVGIREVTVHAAPVPGITGVDRWVAVVEEAGAAARGASAVVPLRPEVLPQLLAIAAACVVQQVTSVAFTLPFRPKGSRDPATPVAALVEALREPLEMFRSAGIPVGVKGIPPCLLGGLNRGAELSWRTPNRWYVDADHQRDRALLFLPDVVRFTKTDDCRRCGLVTRCDGLAEGWLGTGFVDRLVPVEPSL